MRKSRDILQFPAIYNGFTHLFSGRSRQLIVDRYIRARRGDAVLDIGCGTASVLAFLPDVRYFGFDPSANYIEAARRRFGHRGEFYHGVCKTVSLPQNQRFDLVMALGVLHHVDDEEALSILRLARSVLKPTGRFFSIDGCFVPSQPVIAKWLVGLDRGRHIRTAAAYQALASNVFSHVEVDIQHRLLRFPYTHILIQSSPQ